MDEPPPGPPIDLTTFDLIIVGTGLTHCVIAAAASPDGKSVLHLDPNPFYGSHFSSLPDLTSSLNSNSATPSPPPAYTTVYANNDDSPDYFAVRSRHLAALSRHRDFHIPSPPRRPKLLEEHARKFNVDVSGPRVLFYADKSIDLLLKSGVSQYVELKSIGASFVGDDSGKLWSVPDSRAAIFKDKSLSLMEKNQLMRLFKLVQGHLAATTSASSGLEDHGNQDNEAEEEKGNARVSKEDLKSPFVEFFTKMRSPPKIKSIILYAIALADYDQEKGGVCKHMLDTRDGIDSLALYQSSAGRFENVLGALIYPVYGKGELPQAFLRCAAVKGCIYDYVTQFALPDCRGIDIYPWSVSRNKNSHDATVLCFPKKERDSKLARFVNASGCFANGQGGKTDFCMGGCVSIWLFMRFVLYLSALCDDVNQGKKLLNAAKNAPFIFPDHVNPESSSTVASGRAGEVKSTLLWSALYIQELSMLFRKMYPEDEFFPEASLTENSEDDGVLSLLT